MGEQRVIESDQERRGLAGTGLRLAGHVPPGECDGQRLRLDRRALREAGIADAREHRRGQSEVIESHGES